MRGKRLAKAGGIVLGGLAVLVAAAGLVFVPFASGSGYTFVDAWGDSGSGPGELNDPTGIAVTANEVFVADARNGRIQVFDHQGRFKRAFGAPGEAPAQLGRPMNLTIRDGELYAPEYMNDRIPQVPHS